MTWLGLTEQYCNLAHEEELPWQSHTCPYDTSSVTKQPAVLLLPVASGRALQHYCLHLLLLLHLWTLQLLYCYISQLTHLCHYPVGLVHYLVEIIAMLKTCEKSNYWKILSLSIKTIEKFQMVWNLCKLIVT